MKLNFGRRLVLFVHWLLSLAGCALAVTLVAWPACRETALALLEREGLALKIYVIAVVLVYLIFSVGAVCIICGGRKRREKDAFISVNTSETGRTRIAVGAVDQMIRQAVRGVDGIAEMKTNIINNEDSIAIAADVAILNGTHVPTVTANIQRAIRGYIEQNCGVAVRGVSVSVHSLADAEVPSKRGRRRKSEAASSASAAPIGGEAGSAAKSDWSASSEPGAITRPLPEIVPMDASEEITASIPKISPVEVPEEPSAIFPEDAPIALTLDPEPEAPAEESAPEFAPEEASEEPAFAAEEDVTAEEPFASEEPAVPVEESAAPVEESAAPAEEPVASEEPAAPTPKKRRFGRIFGKRDASVSSDAPGGEGDGQV